MARVNLYSKEEIDNKFSEVESDVYTKAEVDALINNIVSTTYTRQQVNSIINERLNGVTRIVSTKLNTFADFMTYITTHTLNPGDFISTYLNQNGKEDIVSIIVTYYEVLSDHIHITGSGSSYYGNGSGVQMVTTEAAAIGFDIYTDNSKITVYTWEYNEEIMQGVEVATDFTPSSMVTTIITNEEV